MKYFSEITRELYDSPEALREAEIAARLQSEANKVTNDVKVNETNKKPSRKQLAADIEKADECLKQANNDLCVAQKKVQELSEAYLKQVEEIINPAKKKVKDAQKAKYEAISRFNQEYGVYQVSLTGAKAAEEMLKTLEDLSRSRSLFNPIWF